MIHAELSSQHLNVGCSGLQAAGVKLTGEFECVLKAGPLHVLRGANGVGKSTLLRAIGNALPGHAVLFKPEYGLRDDMLVCDHLNTVLSHLPDNYATRTELLQKVSLSDWEYERIGTLSSGQRARLGMCVLLAARFNVWLLDEPLNALDSEGHEVLAQMLLNHLAAGGIVLMASHIDPESVLQHMRGVRVCQHMLEHGHLRSDCGNDANLSVESPLKTPPIRTPILPMIRREWVVLWGNPQAVLWGALFHWMVLSFFGIGLGKPSVEFSQVAVWVSLMLAVLLNAKDWFTEDHRVGWLQFLGHLGPGCLAWYWLVRILCTALAQIVVLVPVTGLVAVQYGLNGSQSLHLIVALLAGVWAMVPLLGLVALLLMLTRGGAVLVYLFSLPLLVPVLIFGLEASRAVDVGRDSTAPLAVLFCMGLLGCLAGPALARRLIQLIQE